MAIFATVAAWMWPMASNFKSVSTRQGIRDTSEAFFCKSFLTGYSILAQELRTLTAPSLYWLFIVNSAAGKCTTRVDVTSDIRTQ